MSSLITITPYFISSPECAHLSPGTCKLLFMFLHINLRWPSSYCIPHAIMQCQMTILISYFACLAARFFPREDCSIRPLAPLFAYFRIWNRLIRQNVGSFIRWLSSMRFHLDQEACCPFVVSRWLLPKYTRQVPPPTLPFHIKWSTYWLLSTMTGWHTNTATAPLWACYEAHSGKDIFTWIPR